MSKNGLTSGTYKKQINMAFMAGIENVSSFGLPEDKIVKLFHDLEKVRMSNFL